MTSYIIIQIIGTLLILLWALALFEQLIKKGFDLGIFIILIISSLMLLIILIPDQLRDFFEQIGFARPLDAFLVITSITSLLIVGKVYLKQNELNRNITKIIQNISIKDLDDFLKNMK